MKSVSAVFSTREHRFTIDLVDEFLAHRTYQHAFCLKLIGLGKDPSASWDVRRLATLMAEHQILKLQPDELKEFDALFSELRLKLPGLHNPIASSVLKEGYSTTGFREFVVEFLRRLARMDRVHRAIRAVQGSGAGSDAVQEFIEYSRRDCRLTLARYLFTPDDVMREVLRHLVVTDGVRDVDVSQPRFIEAEIKHNLAMLPEYEAGILQRLCAGSKVYWVAERTSSAINSLVEYPLSTVVLVIKPPGSDIEFELKRAGRKGGNALSVVFKRNGRNVPSSHRLDGGSMQWLLRYEARSGSKMSSIFRLVHRVDAPMPGYIARNTVYSIPTRNGAAATSRSAPAFRYFTDPEVFGEGRYREMRSAMASAVKVYERDEGENLPAVGGEMGLTAEFLSHVAPAQAILCGTSSFRVDKLATYLSSEGAEKYFREYQDLAYSADDARRFADELLDEVLGVYVPPSVGIKNYGRYVDAAFAVPANRARAVEIFLSFVQQIAEFWGTVMGIRGQSRGESFVGRNVGIRSVWVDGDWRVKLVFMDHDALTLPDHEIGHFFAQNALPGMLLDERHIWGKANPALFPTSLVGYLIGIYRIDRSLEVEAQRVAESELLRAYKKTQQAVLTDRKLRAFLSEVFVSRLLDWDEFVAGYLRQEKGWKTRMKRIFKEKGYEPDAFEYYREAVEKYRGFIDRNVFLYLR